MDEIGEGRLARESWENPKKWNPRPPTLVSVSIGNNAEFWAPKRRRVSRRESRSGAKAFLQ